MPIAQKPTLYRGDKRRLHMESANIDLQCFVDIIGGESLEPISQCPCELRCEKCQRLGISFVLLRALQEKMLSMSIWDQGVRTPSYLGIFNDLQCSFHN